MFKIIRAKLIMLTTVSLKVSVEKVTVGDKSYNQDVIEFEECSEEWNEEWTEEWTEDPNELVKVNKDPINVDNFFIFKSFL